MPISDTSKLGTNVKIYHPDQVNLYGCSIGDDSRVGSFVEIQKNATIGARCKISSHSFICEGVVIEDEVFIGHGVMFTNDRLPRATNPDGSPMTERRLEARIHPGEAGCVNWLQRHHSAGPDDRSVGTGRRRRRRHKGRPRFRDRSRRARENRRGHATRIRRRQSKRILAEK